MHKVDLLRKYLHGTCMVLHQGGNTNWKLTQLHCVYTKCVNDEEAISTEQAKPSGVLHECYTQCLLLPAATVYGVKY